MGGLSEQPTVSRRTVLCAWFWSKTTCLGVTTAKEHSFRYASVTNLKNSLFWCGHNTLKNLQSFWKSLKNHWKIFLKKLPKNIVPKVGISKILPKPLKQRLINLLTIEKSLFRRLGLLKSFENLWLESYDLRPGLVGMVQFLSWLNWRTKGNNFRPLILLWHLPYQEPTGGHHGDIYSKDVCYMD